MCQGFPVSFIVNYVISSNTQKFALNLYDSIMYRIKNSLTNRSISYSNTNTVIIWDRHNSTSILNPKQQNNLELSDKK